MTEPLTVELAPRDLLVVAGLPGAGKTTMLREVRELPVLDSDQVRARMRSMLPEWLPYRFFRPVVHAWHRLRVVGHAAGAVGPVIVHEPSTRASTRMLLALVAAVTGRRIHLLWLDVTADEALAGQRDRGRLIRPRSFARHVRRAERFRRLLLAQGVPRGWHSARVTTRGREWYCRLEPAVTLTST